MYLIDFYIEANHIYKTESKYIFYTMIRYPYIPKTSTVYLYKIDLFLYYVLNKIYKI